MECRLLISRLVGLVTLMEENLEKLDQLTLEQEMEFARDIKLLCFAHCIQNGWSFDEIVSTYDISQHEGINMMAKLDGMKLVDMLPGNQYKLRISRKFRWIKSGPIQNFFEKQLQAEFFDSRFNKQNEIRLFVSSMLSNNSVETLIGKLKKVAGEMDDLHHEDQKLALDQKQGMSMMLSLRPWETKVFTALRRSNEQ